MKPKTTSPQPNPRPVETVSQASRVWGLESSEGASVPEVVSARGPSTRPSEATLRTLETTLQLGCG